MSETYLVCGLGNPGKEYENTRHNMGFLVVDKLATKNNIQFKQNERDYVLVNFSVAGKKIFLMKPLSYMNNSGIPLQKVMSYYKIDAQRLIVVHDELDIEPGRIKLTFNGGSGGHNGIRSIISHLNTKEFYRLKVGIGKPKDPIPTEKWVLSEPSEETKKIMEVVIDRCCEGIILFIEKGPQIAMNFLNIRG